MEKTDYFKILPPEIKQYIFSYIETKELVLNSRCVSEEFKDYIDYLITYDSTLSAKRQNYPILKEKKRLQRQQEKLAKCENLRESSEHILLTAAFLTTLGIIFYLFNKHFYHSDFDEFLEANIKNIYSAYLKCQQDARLDYLTCELNQVKTSSLEKAEFLNSNCYAFFFDKNLICKQMETNNINALKFSNFDISDDCEKTSLASTFIYLIPLLSLLTLLTLSGSCRLLSKIIFKLEDWLERKPSHQERFTINK